MFYPRVIFVQSAHSVVVTNDGVKQLICLAASEAQLNKFFQVWHQMNTEIR